MMDMTYIQLPYLLMTPFKVVLYASHGGLKSISLHNCAQASSQPSQSKSMHLLLFSSNNPVMLVALVPDPNFSFILRQH